MDSRTRIKHALRTAALVLVVTGLPTGFFGCGSAGEGNSGYGLAEDTISGVTGTITALGSQTWAAMIEFDAANPPDPDLDEAPFMEPPTSGDIPASEMPASPPGLAPLQAPREPSPAPLVYGTGFEALPGRGTIRPPDTMGAAGPNHLVAMLNTDVRVQDKTGALVQADVSLISFFSPAGHSDVFDPKILYDALSGRWIACACATRRHANSAMVFAISATNDPTGTWTYYSLDGDPTDTLWVDFPGFGVNSQWIVMTANMFPISSGGFGVRMWVIDKSTALAGGALTVTDFFPGFSNVGYGTGHTIKPCVCMEPETDLWLVDMDWSFSGWQGYRLSHLTGTGSAPVWAVHPTGYGTFPYPSNHTSTVDAPQLGSSTLVATNGGGRVWSEPVWRNDRMWWTYHGQPVPGGQGCAVYWQQIDPTTPTIDQHGVIDGGTGVFHFFSAIGVNKRDDVVIGFSRSDATRYPEAVLVQRDGTDSPGTVGAIQLMKAGEAPYNLGRWGDYSATCVDPTDDLTIWTIQEYGKSPTNTWSTWWTRMDALMTITGCPADQTLACTGAGGAPYSFTLTATNPRGTPFVFDFYVDGIQVENNFIPGSPPGPAVSTRTFTTTYPIGTSTVLVIADDGNTSDSCTFDVTVHDSIAPALTCPGTIDPTTGRSTLRAECTGPSGATVTFASTVTDNCDPNPTVTYTQNPGTTFPLGTTAVTCTAMDTTGNTSTCAFDVVVEDTTPPFVAATARRLMLFLPRNGLIDCLLNWAATDTCDASLTTTVAVYSNQGDAGAPFTPDAAVTGSTVEIRAEVNLASVNPGRVFLIVVEATDAAGLTGRACTWVIVPKTATAQDVVGARNIAVAAEGPCDSAGTIPGSWHQILPPTPLP